MKQERTAKETARHGEQSDQVIIIDAQKQI